MKQKEKTTVFGRRNYRILVVGSAMIVAGYLLMSGEGSTPAAYNPDIFSEWRIRIAPVICLAGYLINVFGLLYRTGSKEKNL
ncbi:DUF3098 domain-containing protein [uncultured Bacteroides sp.]|uniref:DUF3098 domain-containing protein n=1 Tax=uncultured Bacteroides sp. TaxID=162156 RepID=UPI0025EF5995|nr:DUF3098 domain-containing protein [uncultured Bacteroides sp.]